MCPRSRRRCSSSLVAVLFAQLAVVVVGVPATPLLLSRARFCMSAAHKTEDLEYALDCIGKVLKTLMLDYGRN